MVSKITREDKVTSINKISEYMKNLNCRYNNIKEVVGEVGHTKLHDEGEIDKALNKEMRVLLKFISKKSKIDIMEFIYNVYNEELEDINEELEDLLGLIDVDDKFIANIIDMEGD